MTSYKDYVSASELDKRGYQLDKDGVLATEHFQTVEDAVDDFMQNSFDIVQELVRNYRGRKWTDAFYEDMKKTDLTGKALEFQEALKEAIIQQAIYTYDNGDASASAYKGESHYAPKAVSVLWGLVIGNF
jgi:hypothetical protein